MRRLDRSRLRDNARECDVGFQGAVGRLAVAACAFDVMGDVKTPARELTVSGYFHSRATELDCKRRSYRRVSKVPANIVLAVFAATASKTCFDISLGMKRMHRIEPPAEATRRYSHLDDVRKLPFKGFGAWATCHRFTGSRSPRPDFGCSNSLA